MAKEGKSQGEESVRISVIKASFILAAIILAFIIYDEIFNILDIFNYIPPRSCNGYLFDIFAIPGFFVIYPLTILGLCTLFYKSFLKQKIQELQKYKTDNHYNFWEEYS